MKKMLRWMHHLTIFIHESLADESQLTLALDHI